MLIEKFKQLKINPTLNKKKTLALAASLLIALIFVFGTHYLGSYFTSAMWIINTITLGLLLSFFMIIAGFAVLKSLFFVAAELSLLIFLAQSYCAVPNRLAAGNDALKSLLVIGILYIAVSFFRSLYAAIKDNYKKVENEKWSWEKIFTVSLYLFFTFLFVWQVYRVMEPIVFNLCVYK